MYTIGIVIFIVILVAIFAFQNASPVAISFLFWKIEASVAVIIFLCSLAGVIVGMILSALLKLKISFQSSK